MKTIDLLREHLNLDIDYDSDTQTYHVTGPVPDARTLRTLRVLLGCVKYRPRSSLRSQRRLTV